MATITTEQQIIGSLINEPNLLLQTDKYQFDVKDFRQPLYRAVFWAIQTLANGANGPLQPYELESKLSESPTCKTIYDNYHGRQTLIDEVCEIHVSSFDAIYTQFQKENLIEDFKRIGIDTTKWCFDHPKTDQEREVNEKYANSNAEDILNDLDKKLMPLKSKYTLRDTSEVQTLVSGMEEMLEELEEIPEVGLQLQGDLFSTIIGGAIKGRFYLRSGASGLGKTRNAVADACYLAFPIRYSWKERKWERSGNNEKVMVIITEQSFEEIRKMAIAYLTGINETKIKKCLTTEEEKKVIKQAIMVFKTFEENFYIIRVPNPNITLVKQLIREQVALHEIEYVFYDYVFINPSLLGEFRGANLRNDEILLMFSDALKQIAVELNIFIMSSTQVNAKADDNQDIRNEASLAGSRAVINKADMGCIMARPSKEEIKTLEDVISEIGIEPNVVTDIYKNRGEEYTQVRIWSQMDLGTMRRKDLFITNSRLEIMDIELHEYGFVFSDEEELKIENLRKELA